MEKTRSLICTVVGHVDHGKTSILDRIRHTTIVETEAGRITQAIGASIIPLQTIQKICGPLLEALKMKLTIPGLLFIDTPGHAAFTNLRKRGGNLADIAILVVDIKEGFKPQTIECIEILKQYKTPFVIAANKIDLIEGWKPNPGFLINDINSQAPSTTTIFETKLYELVGKLNELGFNADRFDRVEDYTKQIAIVPTSAATGEGMAELLMVVTGLAQKFLEQGLKCDIEGPAKGIILEVKEEKGLGTTLDVIIYDGHIDVNDTIVIGGLDKPIVSKVRALLVPAPLAEMRDKKTKFSPVKEVFAATGVKISAPDIDEALAGMPIRTASKEELEKVKEEIQSEVEEVLIETDRSGVTIKADTLGSLEALIKLLKEKNITIKKATIGLITKKDISEVEAMHDKDPMNAILLGFNTSVSPEAQDYAKQTTIKILTSDIIYKLIEDFEAWKEEEKKRLEAKEIEQITRPCKIEILRGYIFRQSNPAVVGVEVSAGTVKAGIPLMKADGVQLTYVKAMQKEQETISEAKKGEQFAMSMEHVTVGRQVNEGDVLYSFITDDEFRKLKEFKKHLSKEEIELLKEIAEIMRKNNPLWGI